MPDVIKASGLRPNPNPIDPDVKVPAAVLRAAKAAEAAQLAAYPELTPEAPPATPPVNAETISIAQPVTPNPPAPPATPPVTPPSNEPPASQQPGETIEEWQHRFRSAEGRRIRAENERAQMADRLAQLESENMDLRNRPAPTPSPVQRLVTEDEEKEYGDMLDVMGRRAKESISPELAELRSMMTTIQTQLEGTSKNITKNAQETMLSSLDSQMPEWRQINKTDEFKEWLSLRDPLFGASRHSALIKAYEQNDTGRVLNFFKGFVSELAATTPANDLTPAPQPAPAPAKVSMESLAAPGRARTSAQVNAPAEKQIITTADIDAFYAAVRRGEYNGREDVKTSLEAELFAAQREGRVRAA